MSKSRSDLIAPESRAIIKLLTDEGLRALEDAIREELARRGTPSANGAAKAA